MEVKKVRKALVAAMRRLDEFKDLNRLEFRGELEWHLREVRLGSRNRIMWRTFEVGQKLFVFIGESQLWRCFYCQKELDTVNPNTKSDCQPTLEHIVPLSKGGIDHPNNLVIACYACNNRRENHDLENFL